MRRLRLALLSAALLLLASGGRGEAAPLATALDAVAITVSDLDRSLAFFTGTLGFEKVSEHEVAGEEYERLQGVFGVRMRVARLRLGQESLELREYLAPSDGRPVPDDSRANDRWFQHVAIIVRDIDEAYRRLRANRVRHASSGPQCLPDTIPAAAGICAFYFRDPDGHFLEILEFPSDKGDPKWRRPDDRLFLGIDHTAIVVGDTEASLHFYRDTLGLRVAGESENFGTAQEHLNNVFGARLRITALRAAAGPGIELLEYLAPRGGRPVPPDLRANDVAHWQTRLLTSRAQTAAEALRATRFELVSPGAIVLADRALGFAAGLLVRDPDGHVIELASP